ncbi:GntR family transcriptional regulator [Rheinheimera sp. SA_1]|jgi:GntR family transcriptional regulator|uniref:GntR family transcriptional regulator n=1 Tax=Rheinheimera sp. SA_1 TaxID=1827365 RepID=UPI00080150B5|nr:GntR family transcriptional regulator [Rheinheimera sp. SA_1]OBP13354.1 GntR family transcriptional regulator [Rheinheimera sp. SA_1]
MFILNPNAGEPIYRQLVEQIRRLIASGQLQPGTEMPSVRELANNNAINPMTISKAYSLLEAEGLLERQRGKPMTVASSERPTEDETKRLLRIQPQLQQLIQAARQLQLSHEAVLQEVARQLAAP